MISPALLLSNALVVYKFFGDLDFLILFFITVLKEMVFQSFEVQTYDYLVKPVDDKQFEKTMERLYASMQNSSCGIGKNGYSALFPDFQSVHNNQQPLRKPGSDIFSCLFPVSRLRSREFSGVVLQYMKNM